MHRDKKVGLALGILLCSIVGAFFFRDDAPRNGTPELKDAKRLDNEIARGNRTPYAETDSSPRGRSRAESDEKYLPDWLRKENTSSTVQRNRPNTSRDPFEPRDWNGSSDSSRDARNEDNLPAVPIPPENIGWDVASNENPAARRSTDAVTATTVIGRSHVVVDGETLSSIAGKYLGSQTRYLDVFNANKDQLKSPNDLKVGMKLNIPDSVATKSSGGSRTTNVERATTERTQKSTPNASTTSRTTNRVTSPSGSEATDAAKKLKFKPAKPNPALRRSAEAEEPANGKSLSQVAPHDLLKVDEEILAKLEKETQTSVLADTPEDTKRVPQVAQADRTDTPSDDPMSEAVSPDSDEIAN